MLKILSTELIEHGELGLVPMLPFHHHVLESLVQEGSLQAPKTPNSHKHLIYICILPERYASAIVAQNLKE